MKAELPTEEDVLAALLVRWMILSPEVGARGFPLMAWAQVPMAVRLVAGHGTDLEVVEAAIADSERRLDCERARDAVLKAVALTYGVVEEGPFPSPIEVAYERLMRAEMEVSRHGG